MKTFLILVSSVFAASSTLSAPVIFQSPETPATLIELYSSEGCSSCPPAEAWVSVLKNRPDLWTGVVPVVFHVDYWDNLGWPDRFASHAFSERQRRYANAWATNSVYTPGFVVNGGEWRGWFDHGGLPAQGTNRVGKLRVTLRDAAHVDIAFTPAGTPPKSAVVEVALLGNALASDVKRGENSGHRLVHDFVVLHLSSASLASDGNRLSATLALPEKSAATPTALAAWVRAGGSQAPIQATGGWLGKE